MARKLANQRTEEICKEFNLSRATVYRALSDARKLGYLKQAQDWLTMNVVPLSLAAIEEALLVGDIPTKVDTAFRVLDGLGITGKHAILSIQDNRGAGDSFEEFRATVIKRVRRAADGSPLRDFDGDGGGGREGEAADETGPQGSRRLLPPESAVLEGVVADGAKEAPEDAGEDRLHRPDGRCDD